MASWSSILPEHLNIYEIWIGRFFLLLGILVILPWILLIVYDALLFVFRSATYDIPVIGGRARGRARPRGISLTQRPGGQRRGLSFSGSVTSAAVGGHDPTQASGVEADGHAPEGLVKRRALDAVADGPSLDEVRA